LENPLHHRATGLGTVVAALGGIVDGDQGQDFGLLLAVGRSPADETADMAVAGVDTAISWPIGTDMQEPM
jgi:hypothetical protein